MMGSEIPWQGKQDVHSAKTTTSSLMGSKEADAQIHPPYGTIMKAVPQHLQSFLHVSVATERKQHHPFQPKLDSIAVDADEGLQEGRHEVPQSHLLSLFGQVRVEVHWLRRKVKYLGQMISFADQDTIKIQHLVFWAHASSGIQIKVVLTPLTPVRPGD